MRAEAGFGKFGGAFANEFQRRIGGALQGYNAAGQTRTAQH